MPAKPRLLVSLFNPEEVRAAVAGGAEIIDCEDARAEVGMFKPRTISDIAYAVRQNEGARRLRISANIGFGLLLYRRTFAGGAVARTLEEIQAKAAQEALGMAASMDTGDRRPNIVKFGIDGLRREYIAPTVRAVKNALAESHHYQDHQVICGVLETDAGAWKERKTIRSVVTALLNVNQFYFEAGGDLDVREYILKPGSDQPDLEKIREMQLNAGADTFRARLIDPFDPKALGLPEKQDERLRVCVEEIAKGGADGVMIDTPVSAKASRICLLDHQQNGNDVGGDGLASHGVFAIDTLKRHSDYCQYHYMECWLAGSIQPYHAQALAHHVATLDVVLCRSSASATVKDPFNPNAGGDARFQKRIDPDRVAAMAAAVHG